MPQKDKAQFFSPETSDKNLASTYVEHLKALLPEELQQDIEIICENLPGTQRYQKELSLILNPKSDILKPYPLARVPN